MQRLPPELLAKILSFVPLNRQKVCLLTVCSGWRSALLLPASHQLYADDDGRWTNFDASEFKVYSQCCPELLNVLPMLLDSFDRSVLEARCHKVQVVFLCQSGRLEDMPEVFRSVEKIHLVEGGLPAAYSQDLIRPNRFPSLKWLEVCGDLSTFHLDLKGFCLLKTLTVIVEDLHASELPWCKNVPEQCHILVFGRIAFSNICTRVDIILEHGYKCCHDFCMVLDYPALQRDPYQVSLRAFSKLTSLQRLKLDLVGAVEQTYLLRDLSCLSSTVQHVECTWHVNDDSMMATMAVVRDKGWQLVDEQNGRSCITRKHS